MSDAIRWESEAMLSVAQKLDALSRELASCRSIVVEIASGMDRASGSTLQAGSSVNLTMAGIRLSKGSVSSYLRRCGKALDSYGDISAQAAGNVRAAWQAIEDLERELRGDVADDGEESPYGSSGREHGGGGRKLDGEAKAEAVEDSTYMPSWESLARKFISKFGAIGSAYSGALGLGNGLEGLLDFGARAGDLVVKWIQADAHDGKFWLELIGHKVTETTGSFFGDVGSSFLSTMAKPVKWVTTIIKTGFDNFEEFGGEETDRCWVEWGSETVATMLIDAGVQALITGGVLLLGGTPVTWAVGLGTAAVTTLADVIWANTGGDGKTVVQSIGTWVGDRYEDLKAFADNAGANLSEAWEGVKETAHEAWEGVKETAHEAWEGVKETADEAWEDVKETASDVKDWMGDKVDGFINGVDAVANWIFG